MGNPLRNTLVYLGLAEDRDEADTQDRYTTEPAPRAEPRPAAAPAPERSEPAPVTPIHKASVPRATPLPTPAAPEMNEILTVHPKAYDKDAKAIAESFRDGVPVIMNLSQMSDGDARRIIDFASGLSIGLNGRIERVTSRVFLLTPEHVHAHGETTGTANEDPTFFA